MATPCVRCGGEGSITSHQCRGSGSMTQPGLFGPKWPTIMTLPPKTEPVRALEFGRSDPLPEITPARC